MPTSPTPDCRPFTRDEWKWREEQFPDTEDAGKKIADHLPKVDPASQALRLKMWQEVLAKLDAIPRAELSAAEQLNYDVYHPQIEVLIADQKFRGFEMPANADTTFWTDIGYTARRPFRTVQDYRNWIAQMQDIPRYFREQMDEMRAGLKRGFTPPQVTLQGRDASITAVTDVAPEASLFYTPVQGDAGHLRGRSEEPARRGRRHHPRYRAADISGTAEIHAQRICSRRPHHARRLRSSGRQGLLSIQDPRIHHPRSGSCGHPRVRRSGSRAPA